MIRKLQVDVTSAGSDGSAVGNTDSIEVRGEVVAVHLDYTGQPATADVTVKSVAPDQTILTVTDNATDGWYYPRVAVQDNAGAGVTFNGTDEIYAPFPVHGKVNVAIAQGNDEGVVRATILYKVSS